MSSKSPRFTATFIATVAATLAVVVVIVFLMRRGGAFPQPGSEAYEQVTRAFYHGLAALEVGLLDDARRQFTSATELVSDEPASWANLGVAQLRLGELDAAVEPITRALTLAPDDPNLVLLAARMEIARGRLDEGVAHLRRAATLDPRGLRTRFALAEEVERAGGPTADADALVLLDELVGLAPENLAVLIERARVAAKANDLRRLTDAVASLGMLATWGPAVGEQFRTLREATDRRDFAAAARATTLMRNLLAADAGFRESLMAVRTPTELIAEPLTMFVRLAPASSMPAPRDDGLSHTREIVEDGPVSLALAVPLDAEGTIAIIAANELSIRRLDGTRGAWPVSAPPTALTPLDSNNDFLTDLAVADGASVRLLVQDESGGFREGANVPCECTAVWAADVEMDGDLDLVAAGAGEPLLLRNNGDGTWLSQPAFRDVRGATAFAWADLDGDADPDAAFLDDSGNLYVYLNRQAGDFVRSEPSARDLLALTAADLDADGRVELLGLARDGTMRRFRYRDGGWSWESVLTWQVMESATGGTFRLTAADLDNNGALDLILSGAGQSVIWLSDEQHRFTRMAQPPEGEVTSVMDLNGDGLLDLLAVTDRGVVQHLGRGTADYHWKVIRPRATTTTGDQRINSFGVGGEIEVRSGLLVQKQLLTGGPVHIGLGDHSTIDVARIVWPNGVAQAEFDLDVDDALVAEQRLKGSCPWVFAWDGTAVRFVTDFLWRSPLGLRINAQDTAGVLQTEDWIRIRGDQLAPRNGAYDIRITAELWETHFFDHVSLMVVDHPEDTEVYVDERFSAARPPALAVHAVRDVQPVSRAWDDSGRDVTDLVAYRDGRYLATFERGAYQGIAEEHFVEFAGPAQAGPDNTDPRGGRLQAARNVLVASGWIYPTDSSINVAIGQGGHVRPAGLSLEAQGADGRWRVVEPDLGFPAGKNKTILIDLSAAAGARRLRLRTNLEVYWDSLAFAVAADTPLQTKRLPASSVDLRYRGFSETTSPRDASPETPRYDRIANRTQRWRDLAGYHTRFGDVRELVATVDDRYVIMNAGDEMQLLFPEQPAPRSGWRRDFVLIGDGWEKDGDYNTAFSQTVLPLPSHDKPDYGAGVTSLALEDDPVYQRHRADWEQYHTRYIAPTSFVRGLR